MIKLKRHLISLLILVVFSGLSHSQTVIPNEFIVKWRNPEAAQLWHNNGLMSRTKPVYHHRYLLSEPMCLDYISVEMGKHEEWFKELKNHPDVLYIQHNRILEERLIPNDPEFMQQWQYINNGVGGVANADLDIELAWDITTGGTTASGDTIVVCVVDEGVNIDHPDLKNNLWVNHDEIPGNGLDDDQNGYVDDYRGWDVTTLSDNINNGGSHGTPVSGIIGAEGNNALGVSGVNWKVKIMFVRYGSATEANALASYAYAYTQRKIYNETNGEKGAFVVVTNASWGVNDLFASEAPLWCEMYDIMGQTGILSCGATTNRDVDVDTNGDMPTTCESPYLITVTNMNRSDQKLTGAGYGRKSIDLGAYGHQTFTLSRTSYGTFGGTSGATPHVSGTAALMYSVPCAFFSQFAKSNPANAALVVRDMLLNSVVANPTLTGITTTGGRLNTHRALVNMMTLCTTCSPPSGLVLQSKGDSVTINWQKQSDADVVRVRFRKFSDQSWTYIQNITNGSSLNGLEYCQEYEIQYSGSCGLLPTEYSYSLFFISGGCCPSPHNFDQSYAEGSLLLQWDYESDISAIYDITYTDISGKAKKISLDSNTLILNNLPECQWYTLSISAFCPFFQTYSDSVHDIVLNTPCGTCTELEYCSFSKKITRDEWIQSVEFGEMNNVSGIDKNGYGNYVGAGIGTFVPDSIYDLTIVPGFSTSPFTEDYSVYIDYNQNGAFEPEEKVLSQKTSALTGVTNQIQIPLDAKSGITRMRVILAFQNHDSPCDKPEFEYGEVEDYCIQISNAINDCRLDESVSIDSLDENTIKVAFTPLDSADYYLVFFKKEGQEYFDTLTIFASPFVISGLDSCQKYFLKIAPNCGENNVFVFTDEKTFSAPCKTSTNQAELYYKTEVYPNPFYDQLHIISSDMEKINFIEIHDLLGKRIPVQWEKTGNEILVFFQTSFIEGAYILNLHMGKTILSKLIVKISP